MEAGVPAARVRRVDEAIAHEQILSRSVLQPIDIAGQGVAADTEFVVPVAGFGYAADGPRVTSPPPQLGRDSRQVLSELGLTDEEIDVLVAQGVVVVG